MRAQVVSFHCVLKNKLGQTLSSSFNRDVINCSEGADDTLPGLIEGLQNVSSGEKRRIFVPANRAYGTYDPELVIEVPRATLRDGKHLTVGSQVTATLRSPDETLLFRVVECKRNSVILDANHPLAGQDLVFDVEVVSARDAMDEDFEDPEGPAFSKPLVH
jgi:FKBP-type peptidyl-prolyl cis-trans isomerase SlyD